MEFDQVWKRVGGGQASSIEGIEASEALAEATWVQAFELPSPCAVAVMVGRHGILPQPFSFESSTWA